MSPLCGVIQFNSALLAVSAILGLTFRQLSPPFFHPISIPIHPYLCRNQDLESRLKDSGGLLSLGTPRRRTGYGISYSVGFS